MSHRYLITVEPLSGADKTSRTAIRFEVENHDSIVDILSRSRAIEPVPPSEVPEFVVGLKLLTEVVLRHRGEPLFEELFPALKAFMKKLKALPPKLLTDGMDK
ncbi:DUF3861 domain-containing protein [Agrobacterium tumefaciens]|uniref:DUF3861 domain-containing protein n=1 Tax=Agrobacterium tumefaciens TaxID=358 RepID=A0AA44J9H4_AGRTU|nr:DUF3861 domain-containing protein [Agrobacterium tumefaciens]NTB87539.1 DUF3861 domain-containing protein [Agrobacterium tumefaciens]NTC17524.1 DUF3861 domain-containing protein [Agrobacterium tumefaciens]NTC29694.1 DUF3861 domain-containing protein [Agrobacterium tumefaciens]